MALIAEPAALAGRRRSPLPPGAAVVGLGVGVSGVAAYAYLVLTARVLGPEGHAPLSALWALAFLVGPGCYYPIEQELGRLLAARRVANQGHGRLLGQCAALGAGLTLVLGLATAATAPALLDRLFDGQALLLISFVGVLFGYWCIQLAWGLLAGTGRFGAYALVQGTEGVVRLLIAVGLAVGGASRAGPYGLALALAPFVAVGLVGRVLRQPTTPGPVEPWGRLTRSLLHLLAASALSNALLTIGPLLVKVIAAPGEEAAASRLLAGLVVARTPLFLFNAVLASLLPGLAALASAGRRSDFNSQVGRLLLLEAGATAVVVPAAALLGPGLIRVAFGPGFVLERVDLLLLAAGTMVFMVAMTLGQVLIALSGHARASLAWAIGCLVMVAVTMLGRSLLIRVEVGFLAGAASAAATAAALFVRQREVKALS